MCSRLFGMDPRSRSEELGETETAGDRANANVHEWLVDVGPLHGSLHRTGLSEDEQNMAQTPPSKGQRGEQFTSSFCPSLVRVNPVTPHSIGPSSDGPQKPVGRKGQLCGTNEARCCPVTLCEAPCPAMAGVKDELRGCKAGHRDVWYSSLAPSTTLYLTQMCCP